MNDNPIDAEVEAEAPVRSRKPLWWTLVILAFIALSAWTYLGTKHSEKLTQQAEASGPGVGTAYNPTTGAVVGAGAVPGALGAGGPTRPSDATLLGRAPDEAVAPSAR